VATRSLRFVAVVATVLVIGLPRVAAAQNELFITNVGSTSVTVYPQTANGNVAATRTLSGAATGLATPEGIAVDLANNEFFVVDNGANSITAYALTAAGNTPPLRSISGAATGLNLPIAIA